MSTKSFMKTACETWLVALFITLPFCAYATPEINQENEECAISFEEQRLMKGKTYTSTMFDDIKSGSFSVSADGKTLTFENLSINGSKKLFYIKEKSAKIVLIGENIVKTDDSYVIGLEYSTLTITGSGSLTTSSSWYDIWLWPGNVNIDSTTLECNGPTAIGNNNYEKANYFNLAIRNSIFKGKKLFRLTSLTMDGCSISTPPDGIFDPDDMDGNQIKDEDWNDVSSFCIDKNINSGVQKNNDVTPQSLGTSYVLKGESLILPVKIVNRGSKPVNSVSYTISTNGNKSAETTVSINIAPQNSATINITMPAGSETKRYEKILTITKVNGVNNEASKNSSVGSLITILEKPTPIPVVEEFTGTWCGWCTIGYDGMEKTNETFGDKVVLIAVHASDPMQISDYHSIAKRATGYPSSIINRSKEQYPDKDILDYEIKKCFDEITVGEIKVAASWADVGKTIIKINTDTKFVYTDDNSQYGIAFVLIEDGMTGKGGEWSQSNYLSGDSYYAESYPFWYNAASKVSGLEFNHVAVAAWDIENGADESVKPSFAAGEVLKYSKEVAISSKTIIQDKSKLKIAALLIDRSTGKIVNANQSPVMDDDLISYGFLYNKENLAENAIVSIDAEENDRGDGLVCETNPSADPKNGLVLSTFDKSQKTGKAKLEIVSNSLDAKQIQWCMGGECVPMNDKNVLEKTFTTDKDGIALVQFDATGIQSKGLLEAVLTTTIDNETHSVRIRFEYGNPVQKLSSMSYLGTQLLTNKEYTSSDFSDIKSGSFKISKDGNTVEFNNLDINCTITNGRLFEFKKDVTIKLTGVNKIFTRANVVIHSLGDLTITGNGSLTTKSSWYDFWIYGTDLTIDNTTLVCEGDVAIGNNMMPSGENIVVKNSTFKGKTLFRLSSFVLINCYFVSTRKIVFDPEEIEGNQLKYKDGTRVKQFEIEPVDDNKYSYGFLYNKENLPENAIVSIDAEEDDRGDGMVCETNPSADPKNGLVLSTFDKSQKTGKAKLEIVSNSLDAKQIQWCMGGECVPMNDKSVLEKTFTTDKDGIALVQFDATGIQSKGLLEAVLTTTIDNEIHSLRIRFEYSDPQEPSSMSYLGTQLLIDKEYTSSDFSDIKSGSFKISKDDKTIEFKDLDMNCTIPESDGCLFQFEKDVTIKLTGTNKVYTKGSYVVHPIGDLTITGSGSLTTKSTWFDFWVLGIDLNIDNTTLICEGDVAIGNNTSGYEANIVVKNSTFKGKALRQLSSFTLINCDFVSTQKIIFDPEAVGGTQLKYEDGTRVTQFEIEPVEGDYANRVSPVAFGDLYFEKNKSRTVKISVQNNGTASVSKVSYVIEIDGVAETENTYILPETVNGIGTTFDLPITITGDSKVGIRIVNLTITKVNGSENSSPDKTVSGRFVTVSPASSHRVVVEEFTGSWCGWCTRGIVGLNMMNDTFGDQVITVAAHASDPMYAKDYGFIFNFTNGYPSCVINRGELMDPYYGTSGSTPFGIQTDILQALSVPVVGSIDVQADWADNNKNRIKMKTKTTFGIDDSSSQFQIGFLLLADGLKGSGSDWAQNNFYAGSNSGDSYLRVIESLPEKITNMEYDHVAIAAWGADKGLSGSVSAPLRADVPQEFTYERNISDNPLVQDKDKLYVVALLLDKTTGKIINAAKCKVGEGSSDPTPGPNPQEGKVFEFRFENKILDNNEAVEITAEEDNWGFGEMNCETNPSSNPKNGLILASKDGKKLSGTATINIVSNTLNPQMVQWCMGGECVPMNGKSTLTKDFTTDNEGICLVMFDATNIKSEGALEARLTATVDNETRAVFIKFVYDKANGISVIYTDDNNAEWYDMNGTRLENAPTRKGVYIRNGKKVIR